MPRIRINILKNLLQTKKLVILQKVVRALEILLHHKIIRKNMIDAQFDYRQGLKMKCLYFLAQNLALRSRKVRKCRFLLIFWQTLVHLFVNILRSLSWLNPDLFNSTDLRLNINRVYISYSVLVNYFVGKRVQKT